jgi:hypothetical protein
MKAGAKVGWLVCALSSANVFSQAASTEYVRNMVTAAQNELTTLISASHNEIETIQKEINALPIITHRIGEIFQGGIVFYVDASQQHGLMASLTDIAPQGVEWRNGTSGDRTVNARAQGLGAGETNTRLIVAEQTIDEQEGQFAALLASSYQIAADGLSSCDVPLTASSPCYGGWYLPSAYELVLLHANLKIKGLGELSDELYWSSTEDSVTEAWAVDFHQGEPLVREKSLLARVRAIHSF